MRRPTIQEAVSLMTNAKTGRYVSRCRQFWEEKFGADFAESVQRAFSEKRKKERK